MRKLIAFVQGLLWLISVTGGVVLVFVLLVGRLDQKDVSSKVQLVEGKTPIYADLQEDPQFVYKLLRLHNKVRKEYGLSPLKLSYELQKTAMLKAFDLLNYNYWAHTNPYDTKRTPWFFIRKLVPYYAVAGENLGKGFSSPQVLMYSWLNSKTHRENILNPRYTHIGIARLHFKGQDVTVVHFANPADTPLLYSFSEYIPPVWIYLPNVYDPLPVEYVAGYSQNNAKIRFLDAIINVKGVFAKRITEKKDEKQENLMGKALRLEVLEPIFYGLPLKSNKGPDDYLAVALGDQKIALLSDESVDLTEVAYKKASSSEKVLGVSDNAVFNVFDQRFVGYLFYVVFLLWLLQLVIGFIRYKEINRTRFIVQNSLFFMLLVILALVMLIKRASVL